MVRPFGCEPNQRRPERRKGHALHPAVCPGPGTASIDAASMAPWRIRDEEMAFVQPTCLSSGGRAGAGFCTDYWSSSLVFATKKRWKKSLLLWPWPGFVLLLLAT